VLVALVVLAVHGVLANRYGFFRDELYFIDCGRHPALGYVDQPPLVPLVAAATQAFGVCLPLLRLVPGAAHALLAWVTAKLARLVAAEVGVPGQFAGGLAALAVACAPMYLGLHTTFNTTSLEPLAWTLVAYLVARAALARSADARAGRVLVLAGVAAGLALEAKYAIPFFLAPLLGGLLLQPERRVLFTRYALLAVTVTVVIAAPSAVWQVTHGLPFLELMRHAEGKNTVVSAPAFVLNQLGVMNPVLAPMWLGGLVAALFGRRFARVRFLAVGYLGVLVAMLVLHGKDYYVAPAYGAPFAIGAVAVELFVARRLVRAVFCVAAVALAAVTAPVALPILDPPILVRYLRAMHLGVQPQENVANEVAVPQGLADMLGWRELEVRVAEAWRGLPAEDRDRVAIITSNYGEAGALNFFGAADGLPRAISGHNQYFLWGPLGHDGGVVLRVNGDLAIWRRDCRDVSVVSKFGTPYAMPYENDAPILLCRGMNAPLPSVWDEFRHYR
jgi:hypothetical protein